MKLIVLCAVLAITLVTVIDLVEGGAMVPVKTKACDHFCGIQKKACLKRCNGFFLGYLKVHTTYPKRTSGSHKMVRIGGTACDYFCKKTTAVCNKTCQGFFIKYLQVHTSHPNKKGDELME